MISFSGRALLALFFAGSLILARPDAVGTEAVAGLSGSDAGEGVAAAAAAGAILHPGDVLVLASWRCSFLQLDRAAGLALTIVESPLTRMVEEGRIRGWGQLKGDIRADYNYHTFYIAPTLEDYRRALGAVMVHMNEERSQEMREFYDLCETTRELPVTVITSRP
jgi:hypothetical protein